jgi:putative tricarboxylic transport membrane protein
MTKALIMTTLGLLAGSIGMDPISGEERFTFGILSRCAMVWDSLPVAMGLFGIAEVLENLTAIGQHAVMKPRSRACCPTCLWAR